MSGFWGTHREDAWHRRKAKEYERESAIRREGEQSVVRVNALHNAQLEQQQGILHIARGLIRDARHDAACAKMKNNNAAQTTKRCASSSMINVASLNNDADDDDDGQEKEGYDDTKIKRLKMDDEEAVVVAEEVVSDMHSARQLPDAVLSSSAGLNGQGVVKLPEPDVPMDYSSHVVADNTKLPPDSIQSAPPPAIVPDAAAASSSSSTLLINMNEKQAEESVRENLLALSYAMFDTLYGCRSFQPSSFVQFLVNTAGERGLAEEIALAAIEKSHGSLEHVQLVLDQLVPQSNDAQQLVESLSAILGQQSGAASVGGKDYLAQWHLQQGNSDQAFAAALLMKGSNNVNMDSRKGEVDVLTHALPLTTTAARRQELKATCPWLLSKNVIGVFTDEEWPDFMSSCMPFTANRLSGSYDPKLESYVLFAASNKVTAPRNVAIAAYYLDKVIASGLHDNNRNPRPIAGASFRNSHTNALIQEFVSIKTHKHDSTKKAISDLDSELSKDTVRAALQTIGLDAKQELIARIGKLITLPPVNECLSKHKNNTIALKCTKCKKAHIELAANLGLVQALREHSSLAAQSAMMRQTYGLSYAPELAKDRVVAKHHFDPEVVAALLGNNPAIYCKQASSIATAAAAATTAAAAEAGK
jgi:hypothetical protein